MRAEVFMELYEKMSAMIDTKKLQIIKLKESATKTTVQGFEERVQSSGSKDKIGNAVADYTDKERELQWEVNDCQRVQTEIEKLLECLPTAEYKVLYKRYVECKELYIIADEVNKSYSWVSKNKRKGLKHVQEILDEREKR